MGVLPAASSHALPPAYAKLMTDPSSPILDFYPEKFDTDMNGKRFAWQAITLLPWIDERRLLDAVAMVAETRTEEERRRDSALLETVFVHESHPMADLVLALEDSKGALQGEKRAAEAVLKADPERTKGMNGVLGLVQGPACPPVLPSPVEGMPDVRRNEVYAATFRLPPTRRVEPRLAKGAVLPPPTVLPGDLKPPPRLWHEDVPRGPGHNSQALGMMPRHQQGQGYQGGGGYGGGGGGGAYQNGWGSMGDPYAPHAQQQGLAPAAHRLLQRSVQSAMGPGAPPLFPGGGPGGPGGPGGGGGYQIPGMPPPGAQQGFQPGGYGFYAQPPQQGGYAIPGMPPPGLQQPPQFGGPPPLLSVGTLGGPMFGGGGGGGGYQIPGMPPPGLLGPGGRPQMPLPPQQQQHYGGGGGGGGPPNPAAGVGGGNRFAALGQLPPRRDPRQR